MYHNIVFAFDEGYAQHFCVAYCSLLENNNNIKFKTYIIYSDLSDGTINILNKFSSRFEQKIEFINIDDTILSGLSVGYHFQKSNYYRLLIPEVIHVDKILYLDSDIIINSSIQELLEIDISDHYLAAVAGANFDRHEELQMANDAKYFNSGVMLINVKKWADSKLHKKAIKFAKENPQAVKFVDQCALNSIVNGVWLPLMPIWNQQASFFEHIDFTYFTEDKIEHALNHPAIIHYTGSSKPWHYLNKHPYKKLYWHYLKKTPYRNYRPEDYCLGNIFKKHIPLPIKKYIKKQLG
ncbi:MAG: glycosyltransferase family 8 protein, partial [Candidatus Electrothrix sp. MAN1_4]|nr:glycosyltransferase family 8 protein [Candidatus Electrothrix sp. MAN1_4]